MAASTIAGAVQDVKQDALNGLTDIPPLDTYQGPDLSGFMRKIERVDLARSNLFTVNFTDFRKIINFDGVVDFDNEPITTNPFGYNNMEQGTDFIWNKVTDKTKDYLLKNSSIGIKAIFGAYDPEIIQSIFGKDVVDVFSGPEYDVNKDVNLLAKAVNIPGYSFDTEKTYQDRRPFTNVKGRTVDNITMTFYCTPNYAERSLFMTWMNKIHNPKKNTFSFYDSVKQRIEIATYNRKGKISSISICQDCIPVRVGPVQLDFDANNQIATFDVEFEVSHTIHVPYDDSYGTWNEAGGMLSRGIQSIEAIRQNRTTSTMGKIARILR
ncbi:tail tube [Cronobacter phage S13]|jgi:hypothetical protein|uniref:Baseplate tail tube initiator n=1 Tax=Cronobacter phage LPCS28 TaxID=2924885 RepID=A0AAE9GAK7_9CAUD|nr:tail tube [Cronobacter phage S13]YP_010665746.1 tail tube [Cronobacter phage LPCS28]AIA64962.1 putative baseplate tail tube initiator [Cronobacter phage S13]UNY46935.1 hypothetical protein EHEKIMEA_00028 [Cronobacter phage LPCS28]